MSFNNFNCLSCINTRYGDIGDPVWECQQCGALMWYQERRQKFSKLLNQNFSYVMVKEKYSFPF